MHGGMIQQKWGVSSTSPPRRRRSGTWPTAYHQPGLGRHAAGAGGVLQQMRLEGFDDERQYRERIVDSTPQKRFIHPSEIGALAAFLCRDDAFGITMQDLTLSAGTLW
jgi:NAD(P)-dependent dehydrogenase (short-subunit alcohol dehydrogenase family)